MGQETSAPAFRFPLKAVIQQKEARRLRLIDADAMRERFCNGVGAKPLDWVYELRDLAGALAEMPTIDALPIVHGYNKYDCSSLFECSVCGWSCYDTFCGDGPYKYCPNCGAKMDGKKKEVANVKNKVKYILLRMR